MLIYLIGFMGSGKSYWGKVWAETMGYDFIDMDEEIGLDYGMPVTEIFRLKGEEFFRDKEADKLRSISGKNKIVACGGGVPCFHHNMDWMNAHGLTVFLKATPEYILKNIGEEIDKRPLFNGIIPEERIEFISRKLEERIPFYEMAKVHLQAHRLTENSLYPYLKNE